MLNYKDLGSGDETLVILHGLFGSLDNWMSLGRQFAEHRRVLLVDQRNHGKSPHYDVMNFEQMSNDLFELLDHLSIETIHLLGHSMGGKVAMDFANRFSTHVSSLMVADIAPREYKARHNDIIDALKSINPATIKTREEADEKLALKIDDYGVRQFLLKNLARDGRSGFRWKMNLEAIVKNYRNIICQVQIDNQFSRPVLFLSGEKSNYISTEDEIEILNFYSAVEIVEVPNAGHWVHAENPSFFYNAVAEFLDSIY